MKKTSEAARMLGRLGGIRGGRARAKKLTYRQRSAIARRGGQARARNARRRQGRFA